MPLGAVVLFSFVPAILAAGFLALLGRFSGRPFRVFTVVVVVVFVLSLYTPFSIPGAPVSMIVALLLMHVVAAAVTVGGLTVSGGGRGWQQGPWHTTPVPIPGHCRLRDLRFSNESYREGASWILRAAA